MKGRELRSKGRGGGGGGGKGGRGERERGERERGERERGEREPLTLDDLGGHVQHSAHCIGQSVLQFSGSSKVTQLQHTAIFEEQNTVRYDEGRKKRGKRDRGRREGGRREGGRGRREGGRENMK